MMKLGQVVRVTGKLEKVFVSRHEVEMQKRKIMRKGTVGISRKYETIFFDELKTGIIAGKRSVVGSREHFRAISPYTGDYIVDTKTSRQTAYLVACDMRGLILVPEECIHEIVEIKCDCEIDLDELDDDEIDVDDDFEDLDDEDWDELLDDEL